MKYYHYLLLFIVSILFVMCDDAPDGVVSAVNSKYRLSSLNAPTYFTYTETTNKFVTSLKLENSDNISDIYLTIRMADGSNTIIGYQQLVDDGNTSISGDAVKGDYIYSATVEMDSTYPSTSYLIEYYVKYESNKQTIQQKIASHTLNYNNGSALIAPFISNLVAPDSIVVVDSAVFLISIDASDANGSSDIVEVYFKVIRPNGTTNDLKNLLNDSGVEGDAVANDGTYSNFFKVYSTNTKGTYIFNFRARDRSGRLSNEISHQIKLK